MGGRSGGGASGGMGSGSRGGGSLPSEHDFFRTTGMKFGGNVEEYQTSLALLNEMPNNIKIFTGATVKDAKAMLKQYIKHKGGSTKVGKFKDWIVDET
jgi:hypothetical protein